MQDLDLLLGKLLSAHLRGLKYVDNSVELDLALPKSTTKVGCIRPKRSFKNDLFLRSDKKFFFIDCLVEQNIKVVLQKR